MSITVKIKNGSATLPSDLKIPDGTEVEIIIPAHARTSGQERPDVRLPVFDGGGTQPGVSLEDTVAVRRVLEQSGKNSQLP